MSQNASTPAILRLAPFVQDSPYGREGTASLAAQFGLATKEIRFEPKEGQPYGEIWFGDHENGPASIIASESIQCGLLDLIDSDPEQMLGKEVYERFGKNRHLPFLFKVLSFARALPLQAHPDRQLAEQLMKKEKREKGKNEQFVDPNHKPEVAVAIKDGFEAFIGFRPTEEIVEFVKTVPELQQVIGKDAVEEFLAVAGTNDAEKMVKRVFGCMWEGDKDKILEQAGDALIERIKKEGDMALGKLGRRDGLGSVITRVHSMYRNDIGLFAAPFFMNFVRLNKGQGISVPADCLHAYLEAEGIVECMARSDNMLSCGFQGALGPGDDPGLFVKALLPSLGPASHLMLDHTKAKQSRKGKTEKYEIPLDEFDILNLQLSSHENDEEELAPIQGPSIWVVTEGKMTISTTSQQEKQNSESKEAQEETLERGQVVYVKPGIAVKFAGQGEAWAAYVE